MSFRYAIPVLLCAGICVSAQQSAPQPSKQGQPQANSKQQTEKPSPAEANPFPEAKSRKAENAADASTNNSSGSSSSHVDLNRLNALPGSRTRISNGEGGYIHDPQLAKQDEKVGKFYLQTKDYKGAYDRFKEATLVAPEDENAVFGLAESARGLHKTREAITNYSIYLEAFPKGKKAKDAEKALAELKSPHQK
ncbi:MAG: hypothetical protein WAM66_03395 [Acidobacteriaceae bacterium]